MPSIVSNGPSMRASAASSTSSKSIRGIALEVHTGINSTHLDAQNAIIDSYFDKQSVFSDPVIVASSSDLIKSAFRGNPSLFKSINKHVYSLTESSVGSESHIVLIDADIVYTFRVIPFSYTIRTLSKITFDSLTSKVIHYEDIWSLSDMVQQLPVVGMLYSKILRPAVGSVTGIFWNTLDGLTKKIN